MEENQVKSVLIQHEAVSDARVEIREDESGTPRRLVATIVPKSSLYDRQQAELKPGDQSHEYYTLPNGLLIAHQSAIQTNILYPEIFESESYLRHGITLSDGDCVFDVGANIGLFTLFVHYQRKNVFVYAFEPSSPTFSVLQANVNLHHVDAKLFDCGLSNEPKMAPLVFFPHMSGMSGLYSHPDKDRSVFKRGLHNWLQDGENDRDITQLSQELDEALKEFFSDSQTSICEFRTLSDIISECRVEHIDLLKIDVEKSELEVLQGIRDEDWHKIEQIVAEVHNKCLLDQITDLLVKQGYDMVVEEEESVVLEEDFEKNDGYRLYMVYAVHRERIERVTVQRPLLSVDELRRFLHAELPDYNLFSDLRHHVKKNLPECKLPIDFVLSDTLSRSAVDGDIRIQATDDSVSLQQASSILALVEIK